MDKENQISVAAIKSGILEIEAEAIKHHTKLIQLRHENSSLQSELEKVSAELQKAKQMKLALEGDLQYQQMRLSELERQQVNREKSLQLSRADTHELRSQMKTERALQIEKLKYYEEKMAHLSSLLTGAPETFDRDIISKEIELLETNETDLKDGIQNIEREIQLLKEKYGSPGTKNLTALDDVSSFLTKDTQLIEAETERRGKHLGKLLETEKDLDSKLEILQRRNGEL